MNNAFNNEPMSDLDMTEINDSAQNSTESDNVVSRAELLRLSAIVEGQMSLLRHLCRLIAESWRERHAPGDKCIQSPDDRFP